MTKLLLGCAVLAVASGCAASRVERKTAVKVVEKSELKDSTASADNTYICEEGKKTGSNIKSPICESVRQRELEREASQDTLRRLMQSGYKR
jgi:hypothetical protein